MLTVLPRIPIKSNTRTNDEFCTENGRAGLLITNMKTKETVAWCTKTGAPDWTEELLTDDEKQIPAAKAWAEANGYTVRISTIDLATSPDFTKTLNL